MNSIPKQVIDSELQTNGQFSLSSHSTSANPNLTRQMLVYGPPQANIIKVGNDDPSKFTWDLREHYEPFNAMHRNPPKPHVMRLRTPPPAEVREMDLSKHAKQRVRKTLVNISH